MRDLLSRVTMPTLVIHARDDIMVPIAFGREIASGIPDARFVALPGKNHVFLEHDPGVTQFFEELCTFVKVGGR